MSAIAQEDVQWEVVDRIAAMLAEDHHEYEVSYAFCLFSSLICWVVQSMKPAESVDPPIEMIELRKNLKALGPDALLESSTVSGVVLHKGKNLSNPAYDNFIRNSAYALLLALRNAIAHADERRVSAIVSDDGMRRYLNGYRFRCRGEDMQTGECFWEATVELSKLQMRAIGLTLAKLYCARFRNYMNRNFRELPA